MLDAIIKPCALPACTTQWHRYARTRVCRGNVTCRSSNKQLVKQLSKCTTIQSIKSYIKKSRGALDHISAAAALVQLAKLQDKTRGGADELLVQLASSLHKDIRDCDARQLANCLWALGQLHASVPQASQLCDAIITELLLDEACKLHQANIIELANIMVGLAKLNRCHLQLLDAAARQAALLIAAPASNPAQLLLPSDQLAYTTDASITTGPADELAASASASASASAPPAAAIISATTKELAGMCWAAATLRFYSPQLCSSVAAGVLAQLSTCPARDLCTVLWALATLGHAEPELYDAAAQQLSAQADQRQLSARDITSSAWALATAAAIAAAGDVHTHTPADTGSTVLMQEDSTAAQAGHGTAEVSSGSSTAAAAYATAAASLLQAAAALPLAQLDQRGKQQLYQALLTFACLGHPLLGTSITSSASEQSADECTSAASPALRALLASCREAWLRQARRPSTSALHKQVAQVLAGMGCEVQLEAPAAGGLLSVDILLAWPDGSGGTSAVALEVDGPTHFSCNQVAGLVHVLGATRARQEVLRRLGYVAAQLAHRDWDELQDRQQQEVLMTELLTAAVQAACEGG